MKKKGITLVEVIISMAIIVVVGAMIGSIFNSSNKILYRVDRKSYLQDLARTVLNYIGDDIKNSKNAKTKTDLILAGNILTVDDEDYTVNNLKEPILYILKKDGSKFLYGKFEEGGVEKVKKIDLPYTKDYKTFNVKSMEIESKLLMNNGTEEKKMMTDIYSINISVTYKGENKSYNTATFIIKEDQKIR